MMQVLFTRSNYVASKLIRGVTGEPVSHCALMYNEFVIHCNFTGIHIELLSNFLKHSSIMFSVPVREDWDKLRNLLTEYDGSWYDFGGMFYIGLRYALPFLPKANLWQSTGMFLCTEWVTEYLDGAENSMITPYQLYLRIK